MAVKPVIEIEVNDDAFRRFYELFESYSEHLDEMPENWRRINDVAGEATETISSGVLDAKDAMAIAAAQAGVIAEALRDAVKAQNDLGTATTKAGKGMDSLKRSAEGVGKAISFVGGWIVRLGAITGIGGILSGLGIGELTNAAFSRSRQAGGLGISPGLLASFQVHGQGYLGTGALEAAANSQLDIRNTPWFQLLGIKNALSENPSDLAFDELRKTALAYRRYQSEGKANLFMQTPEWMAYQNLGGNIADVRRAAMPGGIEGLNAAQRATSADAAGLGFSRETAEKWTNLKITLDRAGTSIQTALIDKLSDLAPEIGILTDDITHFIDAFVNSKDFNIIVNDVKDDLKGMVEFLERVDWVKIGDEINWLADKLGWLTPQKGGTPGTNDYDHAWQNWKNGDLSAIQFLPQWFSKGFNKFWQGDAEQQVRKAAGEYGVDPLLAIATAQHESGMNPTAEGDYGWYDKKGNFHPGKGPGAHNTSFGLFQLHEGGELGDMSPTDAMDPYKNAHVALAGFAKIAKAHPDWSPGQIAYAAQRPSASIRDSYISDVNARYKALANQMLDGVIHEVDADIKKYGRDWMKHLPSDVAAFVSHANLPKNLRTSTDTHAINKTLRAVLKQRTVPPAKVSITNSTSARVAILANALAAT